MSRRPRDEAAAALAAEELLRDPPDGPVLVLEDPRADVAAAARRAGVDVVAWSRWEGDPGGPPCEASFSAVALRLPRARPELAMLTGLAAAALRPGGRLLVYGANDEGIKSVSGHLGPWFEGAATLATGGHARLVGAVRSTVPARPGGLGAWREETVMAFPWGPTPWTSWPGVFAHGRLDEGTALLLRHLPRVQARQRVLDYGAGTGALAAGLVRAAPELRPTALEPDALAAAALRRNVPEAEVVVARGWAGLAGQGPWDIIVSNPPYHRGKEETLAEIDGFLEGVARTRAPSGVMRCVVQRRLPFQERARAVGLDARPVVDAGAYRVWEVGP